MSDVERSAAELDRALLQLQRGVWAGLLVFALVCLVVEPVSPEPPPDRRFTTAAVGLAFVGIVARMFAGSPVAGLRARLVLGCVSLLALLGLGAVAAWMALETGARQTSLFFVLGAAILALRRPTLVLRSRSS